MKKTIITIGSLLLAGSLFAEWQKVEDLEGLAEGYTFDETNSDGTGEWKFYKSDPVNYSVLPTFSVVADPFAAGQGNVLSLAPGSPAETGNGNTTLERNLPAGMQVLDPLAGGGMSATLYFKFARPIIEGVPAQSDTTWGLTSDQARDPVSGTHSYGSYSVLGRTEIDGIIDIRNGGDYTNLTDAALQTNTWYEFWFVIDHGGSLPADEFDPSGTLQSFTMYIKGGTDFPEQTQLPVGSPINALYRNATFDALNTILLVTTTGGQASLKGQDPVYFDDFYIDVEATNLTTPGEGGGETGATLGQLVNISTRGQVGAGDAALFASFVIGKDSQQVLINGSGASELTGVAGALVDPVLEIRNAATNELMGTNDSWESDQKDAINTLWGGAANNPLKDGSTSASILITLPTGSWSGILRGVGDTVGVGQLEVYEID